MKLSGGCYCGTVKFNVHSHTPYPYIYCYCSICRISAGGGGYAVNIMGKASTLTVSGATDSTCFHAKVEDENHPGAMVESPGKRYFCRHCGSALWVVDPRWAQWVYPFASAIETPLPKPPQIYHIMLDFAAPWIEVPCGDKHRHFARYPDESIYDWHKRHGLYLND